MREKNKLLTLGIVVAALLPTTATAQKEVSRAVKFLSDEVETWNRKNHCYSCHNTGDAIRALAIARRHGHKIESTKVAESLRWLKRPRQWKDNKGDQRFNDRQLSELQFSGALLEATRSELLTDRKALTAAASLVSKHQKLDGHWQIAVPGAVGSPITYGRFLATAAARDLLSAADAKGHKASIGKADKWLRSTTPRSVLDSAALLLALGKAKDDGAKKQRKVALRLIQRGHDKSGGWGPFVTSPPQVFDTALVVIALARRQPKSKHERETLKRGRQFLVAQQLEDGSWLETTRPADNDSYAHRISTSAWATIALVESSAAAGKRRDR